MDWSEIITTLGGGPLAIMVVGLVWDRVRISKRVDYLTDKLIEANSVSSTAMNGLARQIETSLRGQK